MRKHAKSKDLEASASASASAAAYNAEKQVPTGLASIKVDPSWTIEESAGSYTAILDCFADGKEIFHFESADLGAAINRGEMSKGINLETMVLLMTHDAESSLTNYKYEQVKQDNVKGADYVIVKETYTNDGKDTTRYRAALLTTDVWMGFMPAHSQEVIDLAISTLATA